MIEKAAVLFSGGVDSTLVASKAAEEAKQVYLLTGMSWAHTNLKRGSSSPENMLPRIAVLKEKHPDTTFSHTVLNARAVHQYLYRKSRRELFKIGLWANLPCATCNPSIFAAAMVFCLSNGIEDLFGGHNVMMSCYPYQHPKCVEIIGKLASSFGVQTHLPVYWYENEDVMMLYNFDAFSEDLDIQKNILFGQSTTKEAQALGLVDGNVKTDFVQKNKPQIICLQDCYVNYVMFLYYFRRLGFEKMTSRMVRHLEMQSDTLKMIIGSYMSGDSLSALFE